jgi:hypothetical protein
MDNRTQLDTGAALPLTTLQDSSTLQDMPYRPLTLPDSTFPPDTHLTPMPDDANVVVNINYNIVTVVVTVKITESKTHCTCAL